MPLVRGGIAEQLAGNGELKDVPVTGKIQILQWPSTIDHEELLRRNASDTSNWESRICAIKCGRGSPKRNPRGARKSWNGYYHVSEIQRARAKSSLEVVRSRASREAAASAHEAGFSGYFYLVCRLLLEKKKDGAWQVSLGNCGPRLGRVEGAWTNSRYSLDAIFQPGPAPWLG